MKLFSNRKPNIFIQIYITIISLIALSVLGIGFIFTNITLSAKAKDQDTIISDLAAMVAKMDSTREGLKKGELEESFIQELNNLTNSISDMDVLVICNTQSIRLYHNSSKRVGDTFVGGDEGEILKGAEPYISMGVGTMGLQRRAFHSVRDRDGTILGFVMVSALQERLNQVRRESIQTCLGMLAMMLIIGMVVAALYSQGIRGIFLGYRPEELVNLYIEREEVMNAMEEGLFAIDTEGRVIIMNYSAKKMLDLPCTVPVQGKLLTDFYPETRLPYTVQTGVAEHDINFVINKKNIISSRIPIRRGGKIIGAVSVFRNKTEVTRLAEELTGTQYMVDSLRAVNHEFMNKLHIILGMLEMEEVDKAREFILGTTLVSGAAVSDIHQRIPIPSLAALLIGKLLRCTELGITFILKKDTYFYSKQTGLPPDNFVTLVGNLVENAIEEINSKDYPIKQIEVGIYSEDGHTTIICDDTGGGIPEEILFSIYDSHTTTKGPGHGTGFYLMKQVVDRYEGTFHIDTEPGEGTSIEINLPI